MADVAFLPDHLTIPAHVLAPVATEASRVVEVPEVVGVGLPVHFHFGKDVGLVQPLHLGDSGLDRLALAGVEMGILGVVEIAQLRGDPFPRRLRGGVVFGQDLDRLPPDKGKRPVDPPGIDRGEILLGELNCIACHAVDDPIRERLMPRVGPILDNAGERIDPTYLRDFLADPQAVKAGTLMPHMLGTMAE